MFRFHLRIILAGLIFCGIILAFSGFKSSWRIWAYLALWVVTQSVNALIVERKNPGLMAERMRRKKDTEPWDKTVLSLYSLTALLFFPAVIGLELRLSQSLPWPWRVSAAGFLLYISAFAFATWAMVHNRHFEATVRIQTDRDHRVICDGPYRFVRHPGYIGGMIGLLAIPLILGSKWAFAPAGLAVVFLILRTALEDATLRKKLAGYAEYAAKVRYRLVPGIW